MNTSDRVRVLAISGSLRRAFEQCAHRSRRPSLSRYCGRLYLPRARDASTLQSGSRGRSCACASRRFRAALQECDAVLISSPEYAHGVPGVLKNALDWVVGSGEFVDKPVALINTSARATHAWASLAETLSVMSACVVLDASITVPLGGRTLDADSVVRDAAFASALRSALTVLASDAREARAV